MLLQNLCNNCVLLAASRVSPSPDVYHRPSHWDMASQHSVTAPPSLPAVTCTLSWNGWRAARPGRATHTTVGQSRDRPAPPPGPPDHQEIGIRTANVQNIRMMELF